MSDNQYPYVLTHIPSIDTRLKAANAILISIRLRIVIAKMLGNKADQIKSEKEEADFIAQFTTI